VHDLRHREALKEEVMAMQNGGLGDLRIGCVLATAQRGHELVQEPRHPMIDVPRGGRRDRPRGGFHPAPQDNGVAFDGDQLVEHFGHLATPSYASASTALS
jgi:hypothetical protein